MDYTVEQVDSVPLNLARGGKWKELRKMLDKMHTNKKPLKLVLRNVYELEKARATAYAWADSMRLYGRVHTTLENDITLYIWMD